MILLPTGDDDTGNFVEAIKSGEPIDITDGNYTITESLPESHSLLKMNGHGKPTINLLGDIQFLNLTQRGSIVRNLLLTGDNCANGILVNHNSEILLENIKFQKLNVGLEFDFAHDFGGLNGLTFYKNTTDFLIDKNSSSSFTFLNSRFTYGQQAVRITRPVANMQFIGCGFASLGNESMVYIRGAIYQGAFRHNRFENHGTERIQLDIKGHSYSYPAQGLSIENNYFTGENVLSHMMVHITKGAMINHNYFHTTPLEYDINYVSSLPSVIENNQVGRHLDRDLLISDD